MKIMPFIVHIKDSMHLPLSLTIMKPYPLTRLLYCIHASSLIIKDENSGGGGPTKRVLHGGAI